MFKTTTVKLTIGSLDDPNLAVETDYNPKELALSRTVPWSVDKHLGKDALAPEFTGSQPRTMDLELLFDSFEKGDSLQGIIINLERMATPENIYSSDEAKRRPHYCVVTWGQGDRATTKAFRCVIESLAIKVTMFARDGAPLRLVANVRVREARMNNDARFDAAEAMQAVTSARNAAKHASDAERADAEWRRRQLANELE